MRFECNFGSLSSGKSAGRSDTDRFRIALLGDFSGRAMSGKLETGDELAKRKPIRVDIDNLDDVIERMGISVRLPMGGDDESIELEIESIDDLHPDELFEKVELFEELKSLRNRLLNDRTAASAADEIREWIDEEDLDELRMQQRKRERKRSSRGNTVPVGGQLSDFARLTGQAIAAEENDPDVDELIKQVIAPYLVAESDPDAEALLAAVDESLSATMRSILHQADFQSMESIWRGVDFLTRRLETSSALQIVLYDISAEELAADLSGADDLEETGLYKLLVEQPSMDANQGSLAALLGHYVFEETPPHAELLGRVAKIAAAAEAPFISSINKQAIDRKRGEEPHPLIVEAWSTLKELPEARYLALTTPQFLLRLPYGKKTDPVEPFEFEEFTARSGVSGMLWGNGVLLVGLMLGQTYSQQGLKKMQIGSVMSFNDMPYHFMTDADGDQIALPCTDRLLSEKMARAVVQFGYIPVLSIQGQPVVRLGSTLSVAGLELAGAWPGSADAAKLQKADREESEKRESESLSASGSAMKPKDGGEFVQDDLMHAMKNDTFDDDDDDDDDDLFGSSDDDDDDDDLSSLLGDSDSDDDDDDLSALLSDSDDDSDDDSDEDASDDDSDDDELAALLASMDSDSDDDDESDSDSEDDDDDGMDAELAALLADL